ncbi:MAG: amino acid permease, partial [Anaerolineales bacterium]
LIHETLGGINAFIAGWSVLAGSVAVGVVLIQNASQLVLEVTKFQLAKEATAVGLLAIILIFQILQLIPGRIRRRSVVSVLIILLIIVVVSTTPGIKLAHYQQWKPFLLGDFIRSIAWTMVGFIGFEALLESRRQIHNPGKKLPRAIRSNLIINTLLLFVILGTSAGLPSLSSSEAPTITTIYTQHSLIRPIFINLLGIIILILGTNGALMTAVRQLDIFCREGAFPTTLREVFPPFRMPIWLFVVITPLIILFLYQFPSWLLIEIAAGMFLLAMILLNVAAIYSRYKEPNRRRTFVLPFTPLFPSIAIAINLILVFSLQSKALIFGGIWLGIGSVYYLGYAQRKQKEAQVGEIVFGRRREEKQKKGYRILVPIRKSEERRFVLSLAIALARQIKGEVLPLQVIPVPDPLAIEEGRRMAQERNTLFQWSTRIASDTGVQVSPITRLSRNVPEGIIDTAIEEDCDLVILTWAITSDKPQGRLGSILDPVARGVPCDVAVLAYHPQKQDMVEGDMTNLFKPSKLLVPTAGGPHAPLAIRLSLLLTKEHDAKVQAVYVSSLDTPPESQGIGETRIEQTITALRQQESELSKGNGHGPTFGDVPIEGRVIAAESVVAGIVEAGKECDLVLIGASEESIIDKVLFGNIPEQVARESETPVLMVKRYRGLPRFWLQRVWDTLYQTIPEVSDEEQIEVYRRLHRGARPSVDFFTMIGLSSMIATFGLTQNSAAVIIGAMLVAPLFTPLMALSLAIVQGNVRLLRLAIESTLKGIALAIGLAALLTALTPLNPITPQILERTQPGLLDLGVAIASGVAGAYAISRKEVAAALPGVAIAAALVPPLGVVGIGLAQGNLSIAGGAGVLIIMNLIAIALAGAITLLLLGFRPFRGAKQMDIRRGFGTAVILFVIISIPLILVFFQSVQTSKTENLIKTTLQSDLARFDDIEIVNLDDINLERQSDGYVVTMQVYTSIPVGSEIAQQLSVHLSNVVQHKVRVRLVTLSLVEPP